MIDIKKTVKHQWKFAGSLTQKGWGTNTVANVFAETFEDAVAAFKQEYPEYKIWSVTHLGKSIIVES